MSRRRIGSSCRFTRTISFCRQNKPWSVVDAEVPLSSSGNAIDAPQDEETLERKVWGVQTEFRIQISSFTALQPDISHKRGINIKTTFLIHQAILLYVSGFEHKISWRSKRATFVACPWRCCILRSKGESPGRHDIFARVPYFCLIVQYNNPFPVLLRLSFYFILHFFFPYTFLVTLANDDVKSV